MISLSLAHKVQRDFLAFDCGEQGFAEDDLAVQRDGERLDRRWTGLVPLEGGFLAASDPDVERVGDVVASHGRGKPGRDPSVSVGTNNDASLVLHILDRGRPGCRRSGDCDAGDG